MMLTTEDDVSANKLEETISRIKKTTEVLCNVSFLFTNISVTSFCYFVTSKRSSVLQQIFLFVCLFFSLCFKLVSISDYDSRSRTNC